MAALAVSEATRNTDITVMDSCDFQGPQMMTSELWLNVKGYFLVLGLMPISRFQFFRRVVNWKYSQ